MAALVSTESVDNNVEKSMIMPQLSREEVINCAITSWYEKFEFITFKSVFVPLPKDFIEYLLSDGCVLPQGCSLPSVSMDNSDSDLDGVDWDEGDTDESTAQAPTFTELVKSITKAIDDLGGAALPKLNWSSPKDAVWMVPSNSMRCTCAAEVILLLKSSNFVTHDLTRVFEYCLPSAIPSTDQTFPYQLCLRRWENVHPSTEFRCFVYHQKLIGVCQRNHTACYKHLLELKDTLRTEITNFYDEIAGKFPNDNYIFDICRIKENKYWLVDFNPYGPMTDPLLFSWEELSLGPQGLRSHLPHTGGTAQSQAGDLPVIRLVDGQTIQPSDIQSCRMPQDIIDLTSGEDIHKFADLFMKGDLHSQESDSD